MTTCLQNVTIILLDAKEFRKQTSNTKVETFVIRSKSSPDKGMLHGKNFHRKN